MLSFNRKIQFSSAYRLNDPSLSREENLALYGEDHLKELGGAFELDAHFMREGFPAIDPHTGMIVSLVDVDNWLASLKESLTSQELNAVTHPLVPTLENLAREIAKRLEACIVEYHDVVSEKKGPVLHSGFANAGFVVRLHKLRLSMVGRPGSVITQKIVSVDL